MNLKVSFNSIRAHHLIRPKSYDLNDYKSQNSIDITVLSDVNYSTNSKSTIDLVYTMESKLDYPTLYNSKCNKNFSNKQMT